MGLGHEMAFHLIVNKNIMPFSVSMSLLYEEDKDDDGFLYMVYIAQKPCGGGECIVL